MESERADKVDVLQGTLILLVLRTLEALGPLHGYGIARRIEQISKDVLQLNQGTLYPALLRMEQEGWIASKWGASEKNRKARFYSITAAGRRRLAKETEDWRRMSSTIERFLGFDPEPGGGAWMSWASVVAARMRGLFEHSGWSASWTMKSAFTWRCRWTTTSKPGWIQRRRDTPHCAALAA